MSLHHSPMIQHILTHSISTKHSLQFSSVKAIYRAKEPEACSIIPGSSIARCRLIRQGNGCSKEGQRCSITAPFRPGRWKHSCLFSPRHYSPTPRLYCVFSLSIRFWHAFFEDRVGPPRLLSCQTEMTPSGRGRCVIARIHTQPNNQHAEHAQDEPRYTRNAKPNRQEHPSGSLV